MIEGFEKRSSRVEPSLLRKLVVGVLGQVLAFLFGVSTSLARVDHHLLISFCNQHRLPSLHAIVLTCRSFGPTARKRSQAVRHPLGLSCGRTQVKVPRVGRSVQHT